MDEDTIYEECSICEGEGETPMVIGTDLSEPLPCVWCDGLGLIEHKCLTS
jgi:hypothetical protein